MPVQWNWEIKMDVRSAVHPPCGPEAGRHTNVCICFILTSAWPGWHELT